MSDKVVRNRKRSRGKVKASAYPKRGVVYVVREAWLTSGGNVALRLVGFPDEFGPNGKPAGFDARCFDKLDEVKARNAAGHTFTKRWLVLG